MSAFGHFRPSNAGLSFKLRDFFRRYRLAWITCKSLVADSRRSHVGQRSSRRIQLDLGSGRIYFMQRH